MTRRKKKFPVIESMTKILVGSFIVRVWRSEKEVSNDYNNHDLVVRALSVQPVSRESLVEALSVMPRVAAIEVVNQYGNGVVAYVEWP